MKETIFALIAAALAIWAMVDISYSALTRKGKVGWLAIAILIPIIGPVAYFFTHKKRAA